jgi:hypothetical protein
MKLIPLAIILTLFLATAALAGPVSHFGMLKVCKIGNKGQLCGDKTGNTTPIFVKGPSLFWHSSAEGAPFYAPEVVDWFVDNMQIGIIRAAMGVRYLGNNSGAISASGSSVLGYYDDPTTSKRMIKDVIDAAIVNDIYVIVDWHSHNAESETTSAKNFFVEIANEYKNVPNIIWEVYNEPVNTGVGSISTHAKTITDALRAAGNNNLVIIGSPQWSKQPNEQAGNWGTSNDAVTKNVAFTFHFYAASHSQSDMSAAGAMNNGYAVFGSEWGFTDANGNGQVVNGSAWTSWMDDNKVSNCNWSASAKNEASAMFKSGTGTTSLSTTALTTSGGYFNTYMGANKWTAQIPSNHPKGNDVKATVKDGNSVTIAAAALGLTGNITEVIKPELGDVTFTTNSITYTTSQSGSPEEKIRFAYKITQGSVTVQRRVTITITERRPILPKKDPIAVSRKMPSVIRLTANLSATDPGGSKQLSFTEVSLSNPSMGTVSITGTNRDSVTFTPNASQQNTEGTEVELNYSVKNPSGQTSSQSVVLKIQNLAPYINESIAYNCCLSSKSNTAPIGIGMGGFSGRDPDGDSIWYDKLYLDPRYPGRLEQVKADSFAYYPENNKTGKIVFLAIITDGSLNSKLGRSALILTGNGTDIGNITPPDNIPGVVPIISASGLGGELAVKHSGFGSVEVYFAQSGFAKLEIYSLSGKNMGTLLDGYRNAGSEKFSLKSLGLQKGVYILRIRQGSQTKAVRVLV